MVAEIICVGTELLLGDITNTNASFMAKELAQMGIFSYYQTVVGDNETRLKEAFKIAFERADIVITSGGLGPTKDDLTKEVAAEYFGKKLNLDNKLLDNLKKFFKKQNFQFTKNNEKQAYIFEGAKALQNDNGTAPGIFYEDGGKMLFMLPGPPNELEPMFKNQIKEILGTKTEYILFSKTLRICGVGEALVENILREIMEKQTNPTLALYAKNFEVHLRITAKAKDEAEAKELIKNSSDEVYELLGENIYAEDEQTLEETIIDLIRKKKYKLSTAESCTGGMLASAIVSVSGCSDVYKEGFVTYSNESKMKNLSVPREIIEDYGVVSKECAMSMAEGCAKSLNTDIAISTTGIAGPDGGTDEKPVGLVYIGLYICGERFFKKIILNGDRQKIRMRSTYAALDFLRRKLL